MSHPKKTMRTMYQKISWFVIALLLFSISALVVAEDMDNETNPGDLNKDGDDNDVNEDDYINGLDDEGGIVDPDDYTIDFGEMVEANLILIIVVGIVFAIVIIIIIIVISNALRRRPDEPS